MGFQDSCAALCGAGGMSGKLLHSLLLVCGAEVLSWDSIWGCVYLFLIVKKKSCEGTAGFDCTRAVLTGLKGRNGPPEGRAAQPRMQWPSDKVSVLLL